MNDTLRARLLMLTIDPQTDEINKIAEELFKDDESTPGYWIEEPKNILKTVVKYLCATKSPVTVEAIFRTLKQITEQKTEELFPTIHKDRIDKDLIETIVKHAEKPHNERVAIQEIINRKIFPLGTDQIIINHLENELYNAKQTIRTIEKLRIKSEKCTIENVGGLRARGCILLYLGEESFNKWLEDLMQSWGSEVTQLFAKHIFDINSQDIPENVRMIIREKTKFGNRKI